MTESSANCPEGQIITTVSECKVASAELGRNYHTEVEYNDRPAGCYGYTTNQLTYFNAIISGKSASPVYYDTVGICKRGILNLALFLNGPVLKIITEKINYYSKQFNNSQCHILQNRLLIVDMVNTDK